VRHVEAEEVDRDLRLVGAKRQTRKRAFADVGNGIRTATRSNAADEDGSISKPTERQSIDRLCNYAAVRYPSSGSGE